MATTSVIETFLKAIGTAWSQAQHGISSAAEDMGQGFVSPLGHEMIML